MGVERRAVGLLPAAVPTFAPERNETWYTDGNYGFFALRLE